MMLASSLRTSVTDGGSAGLRPLQEASRGSESAAAAPCPPRGEPRDRPDLFCGSHFCPGKPVRGSQPLAGGGRRAPSSAPRWRLLQAWRPVANSERRWATSGDWSLLGPPKPVS